MSASKRAAKISAAATFHDHLKELRTRLFAVAAIFMTAAGVAFSYKDVLLDVLMRPLNGEQLIYLTPAGGFSFIFQVSIYAGLIAAVPILIYNIFRFIAPVLSKRTRIGSLVVMLSSVALLVMGVSFGYFYAIPAAMQFLIHFADGYVSASLTAEAYLGFVMAYTAGLGLLFQLPLIIMFIHWIKPLSPMGLLKFERYMILLAFVAAAIISPTPDALNQTILAAPIIVMYQIGVIGVWLSVRRKNKRLAVASPTAKPARKVTKAMQRAASKKQAAAATPRAAKQPATPLAQVQRTGEAYASPSVTKQPAPAVKKAVNRRPIDGVVKVASKQPAARAMSGVLPAATAAVSVPQARPGSYGAGSITAPASRRGRNLDGIAVRPQRQASAVQIPPARRAAPGRVVRSMQQADRPVNGSVFTEKGLDDFLF